MKVAACLACFSLCSLVSADFLTPQIVPDGVSAMFNVWGAGMNNWRFAQFAADLISLRHALQSLSILSHNVLPRFMSERCYSNNIGVRISALAEHVTASTELSKKFCKEGAIYDSAVKAALRCAQIASRNLDADLAMMPTKTDVETYKLYSYALEKYLSEYATTLDMFQKRVAEIDRTRDYYSRILAENVELQGKLQRGRESISQVIGELAGSLEAEDAKIAQGRREHEQIKDTGHITEKVKLWSSAGSTDDANAHLEALSILEEMLEKTTVQNSIFQRLVASGDVILGGLMPKITAITHYNGESGDAVLHKRLFELNEKANLLIGQTWHLRASISETLMELRLSSFEMKAFCSKCGCMHCAVTILNSDD